MRDVKVVEMRMLKQTCSDGIELEMKYMRGNLGVTNVADKLWENSLRWFGLVENRCNDSIVKKKGEIRAEENRSEGVGQKKIGRWLLGKIREHTD